MTAAEVKTCLTEEGFDLERFRNAAAVIHNTMARMAKADELEVDRRTKPTNSCATKLTWTGNSIALWTSWNVCNDSAGEKQYRLLSTLTWEEADSLFAKQSQEVLSFQ
jgi:hypothetical protein